MQNKDLMLRCTRGYLEKSGVLPMIMGAREENGCKIDYKKIPTGAKNSNFNPRRCYGNLVGYMHTVVSLAQPSDQPLNQASDYSILLTSKCIRMDVNAVKAFKKGWRELERKTGKPQKATA